MSAGSTALVIIATSLGQVEVAPDVVLAGIKDGRERLRSGVFRANGREVCTGEESRTTQIIVFCAFDHDRKALRFDRIQPERIVEQASNGAVARLQGESRFIRTPEATIQWHDHYPVVSISAPDGPINRTVLPFDARVLGLTTNHSLRTNAQFEKLFAYFAKQKIIESVREPTGLIRVCWEFGPPESPAQRTIWLDPDKGFAGIRVEVHSVSKEGRRLESTSEATFAEKAGVWVPVAVKIDEFATNGQCSVQMALDWESVNGPPDPKLFTPEGLRLGGATRIVDSRLGRPIVVGNLAESRGPVLPPARSISGGWIAVVTVLSVIALLGIWKLRVWRSSP